MLTIIPCTAFEYTAVAALWNAKLQDPQSCWFDGEPNDAAGIAQLMAGGCELSVALEDLTPVGFGLWWPTSELPRLGALAATSDVVYYRLLAAYCDWGLSLGATRGYAELGVRQTTERHQMDALGVIEYTAIGFEPVAPDAEPAERVPLLLRAECDLLVLKQAIAAQVENLS